MGIHEVSNHIREVEITNFRGIDHLKLEFLTPLGEASSLVVLAGPNGCGKTSVLDAILIALGHKKLARKAGPPAVSLGADDYLLQLCMKSADCQPVSITCNSHADPSTQKNAVSSKVAVSYFSSWREPQLVGSLGISISRRGRRPTETESNRLTRFKQKLIDNRARDLFFDQKNRMRLDLQEPSWFERTMSQLNAVWQRFYPKQSFVVEPQDQSDTSGFDVFLASPRLSVDDLSSGQLELFQLLGELLSADPAPDILLIDEPELHLDQAWHVELIRAIRDLVPGTQLIVATHSPEIFEAAMSFERHFLVPESDPRARFWRHDVVTAEAP